MVSYSHRCIVNKTCPAGHFSELGVGDCEPCDDSCSTCSGRSELECLSCKQGLVSDRNCFANYVCEYVHGMYIYLSI